MSTLGERIATAWTEQALPTLQRYIEIPNVSPAYDAEWEENGHMEAAVQLVHGWLATRDVAGMTIDIQRAPRSDAADRV